MSPILKVSFSVIVLRIFLYHWFSVVCLWCSYKWLILVFIVAGFLIFIHRGHSSSLIHEMLSLFFNQILKYLNIKRIFNHNFFSLYYFSVLLLEINLHLHEVTWYWPTCSFSSQSFFSLHFGLDNFYSSAYSFLIFKKWFFYKLLISI